MLPRRERNFHLKAANNVVHSTAVSAATIGRLPFFSVFFQNKQPPPFNGGDAQECGGPLAAAAVPKTSGLSFTFNQPSFHAAAIHSRHRRICIPKGRPPPAHPHGTAGTAALIESPPEAHLSHSHRWLFIRLLMDGDEVADEKRWQRINGPLIER